MRAADRGVLIGLFIVGLIAAFWFLLLSPKREEAGKLDGEIAQVQESLDASRATIAAAEQARDEYDSNYKTVVALGKAAPSDADTPSLITQVQTLADRAGVEFRTLELTPGGEGAPATQPAAPQTPPEGSEGSEGAEAESATTAATPAPATEATAASLPLGASVGPAGLPVMPYKVLVQGDFFEMADFLAGVDSLVGDERKGLDVGGRLVTVNGFTIAPPSGTAGSAKLEMTLTMTTYVTPADQGLTAGATPTAPGPAAGATPTPTAAPAGGTP